MVVSLWLCPPLGLPLTHPPTSSRSSLIGIIDALATTNVLPNFDPHVTLIGDTGAATSVEEATAQLLALKGAGPVAVEFTAITHGEMEGGQVPWSQSCVALVRETPQLMELHRRALCVFGGTNMDVLASQWSPPLGKPHLSLAYGNSPRVLATLEVPPPFVADSVALWSCEPGTLEGVASWREIARVPL